MPKSLSSLHRTRIKVCGLTRAEDVDAALDHGVDALGFVFWPGSPRAVTAAQATALVARIPPFVTPVGLFVNASRAEIAAVLDAVPLGLLQFHGDETPEDCAGHRVPHLKAARVRPGLDLVEFELLHRDAKAILLDAFVDGYGGGGKVFDWTLVPEDIAPRVVLSGGLNAQNVAEAITRVRPWAVDVSSGVESAKGIKDAERMRLFVEAVRKADAAASLR